MKLQISWAAAVVTLATCLAAEAQVPDQVFDLKGVPARGVIKAITPTEITLDQDGNLRSYPVNEVARVSFADEPAELRRARDAAVRGQHQEALAELSEIRVSELRRREVQQDVLFYTAYCSAEAALAGQGDKNAAGRLVVAFLEQHSDSFHYFQAVETFGDLAYAAGRYDRAEQYYAKLAEAPWEEYRIRAATQTARALTAQEKYPEALQRYEQILAGDDQSPAGQRRKLFATLGKAVCLAKTGKHEEGVKMVEAVIQQQDASDAELFSRAYNALGQCHLAANRPKDALLAYLHTDLLFSGQADAHAEALFQLTQLWPMVNQPDRAVAARNLLLNRYPGSLWASQP